MLNEAILQKQLYKELEEALSSSNFLDLDNEYRDEVRVAGYGEIEQTESAGALSSALKSFFKSKRIPVSIVITTIDPDDILSQDKVRQDNENPNNYLIAAEAGLDKKGKMQLILHAAEASEDFDKSKMDKPKIIHSIATAIRHELVHDRQYTSLSKKMGITRPEAKQKYEDWGLIPGADTDRKQYLGSHIELDAFGHEFAELLANKFGIEKASQLVATADSTELQEIAKDIEYGDNLREYYNEHPQEKFTNTLQKKIRKYLKAFKDQGIYENYLYSKWKKIILVG